MTVKNLPSGTEPGDVVSQSEEFAALMRAVAASQDRAAFARLFDHFAPRIKSYLLRLGASDALSEELTQDVMLTLWRKADLFDPQKSSVGTWLFRIARNRRIDALRRDRSADLDPNEPMLIPEAAPKADDVYDSAKRDERIRVAMKDLPEEQLGLIKMAFFSGLSHSQIAEETGIPLGTVKSRIRLAFGRLRRTLEDDPGVDTD